MSEEVHLSNRCIFTGFVQWISSSIKSEMEMEIEEEMSHFSHEHVLLLGSVLGGLITPGSCNMCKTEMESPFYVCPFPSCTFALHKSCADLAKNLEHPFHSQHPLCLCPTPKNFFCQACGFRTFEISQKKEYLYSYVCSCCSFGLHINCAQLLPIKSGQDLERFTHPHPLFPCHVNPRYSDFTYNCGCCSRRFNPFNPFFEPFFETICVCLQCNALLCESCSELPLEIHSLAHPLHPLTLRRPQPFFNFRCAICRFEQQRALSYQCQECEFHLDSVCFDLFPIKNNTGDGQDELQSVKFNHPHPLLVFENDGQRPLSNCDGCGERFKITDSVWFCVECQMCIDKTCVRLPQEIKHVLHPIHPLTLVEEDYRRNVAHKKCGVCDTDIIQTLFYQCSLCKLFIHPQCASSMTASIKSINHPHPLALFERRNRFLMTKCHECHEYCEPPFFRCFKCKYNLHVYCFGELPTTVESIRHCHPLTLTYSPIKDHPEENDNAEFYCDECEERRRLHEPTYYCAECHYVAHIRCLLTQVVRYLKD